jgi:hypothetical protein
MAKPPPAPSGAPSPRPPSPRGRSRAGRVAAAVELADYQRAYKALKGKPVELEPMVAGMLHAFIEADRGFQAWRKAEAGSKPETGGKADGG